MNKNILKFLIPVFTIIIVFFIGLIAILNKHNNETTLYQESESIVLNLETIRETNNENNVSESILKPEEPDININLDLPDSQNTEKENLVETEIQSETTEPIFIEDDNIIDEKYLDIGSENYDYLNEYNFEYVALLVVTNRISVSDFIYLTDNFSKKYHNLYDEEPFSILDGKFSFEDFVGDYETKTLSVKLENGQSFKFQFILEKNLISDVYVVN